jgi:hypothetical protein
MAEALKQRGIPSSGLKHEIAERLVNVLRTEAADPGAGAKSCLQLH